MGVRKIKTSRWLGFVYILSGIKVVLKYITFFSEMLVYRVTGFRCVFN